MIDERFVIVGSMLGLVGMVDYVRATVRGRIQPNRVTWACWALAPLIAFGAEVQDGVGLRSLMTFTVGFTPLVIFVASFVNPNAYWRLGAFDVACGVLSISSLIGWGLSHSGTTAIVLSIAADALAAVPTVIKTWRHPYTEAPLLFALAAANGTITLLTIDQWTTADAAFPTYIAILASGLTATAYLRRRATTPPAACVA